MLELAFKFAIASIIKPRCVECRPHKKAIRPSVRSSVKRVDYDETKESSAQIFKERTFILVFRHEKWFVGNDSFYLKFWAKLVQLLRKRQFPIDIRSSLEALLSRTI